MIFQKILEFNLKLNFRIFRNLRKANRLFLLFFHFKLLPNNQKRLQFVFMAKRSAHEQHNLWKEKTEMLAIFKLVA